MIHSFNKYFTRNFYRPGPGFCILNPVTKSMFGLISSLSLFLFLNYIFIYLAALSLSCSTWDLSVWNEGSVAPRHVGSQLSDQGRQALNHWTTWEVLSLFLKSWIIIQLQFCFPKESSSDFMSMADDDQALLRGQGHSAVTSAGT